MTFNLGDTVAGRYKVLEITFSDGVKSIYKVEDLKSSNTIVSLVVLNSTLITDDLALQMLKRNIEKLAKISHENLVQVFELINDTGVIGYTQEHHEYQRLSEVINDSLDIAQANEYMNGVLLGVQELHNNSILHNNLSPENILIGTNGVLKIYGQGHSVFGKENNSDTYVAPEYLLRETLNEQTDIYCIGIVCYLMITGQDPFPEKDLQISRKQRLQVLPYAPHLVVEFCPERLSKCIMMALAKEPSERYKDCAHMLRHLESLGPRSRGIALPNDTLADINVFELASEYKHLSSKQKTQANKKALFEMAENKKREERTPDRPTPPLTPISDDSKFNSISYEQVEGSKNRTVELLGIIALILILATVGFLSYHFVVKGTIDAKKAPQTTLAKISPKENKETTLSIWPKLIKDLRKIDQSFYNTSIKFDKGVFDSINLSITNIPDSLSERMQFVSLNFDNAEKVTKTKTALSVEGKAKIQISNEAKILKLEQDIKVELSTDNNQTIFTIRITTPVGSTSKENHKIVKRDGSYLIEIDQELKVKK